MGRRKKEPAEAHRGRIAQAAAALFARRGVDSVTVEEIAREKLGLAKDNETVFKKEQ